MGWWRTTSGGLIGDEPADIIDDAGGGWSEPAALPADIQTSIIRCYQRVWGREPTEQELRELLQFCQ